MSSSTGSSPGGPSPSGQAGRDAHGPFLTLWFPAASGTSSAELPTCSTSSGSSRSPGCLRCVGCWGPCCPPGHSPGLRGHGRGGLHAGVVAEQLSPQGPPNFLRASALAEHIKPVVVIPEEAPEEEEPENLIEISTGPPTEEPAVSAPPSPLRGQPRRGAGQRARVPALPRRWWLTFWIRRSGPPTAR